MLRAVKEGATVKMGFLGFIVMEGIQGGKTTSKETELRRAE